MSMKDKSIRIDCWSGKNLFIGEYDSKEVDKVLDANRCSTCKGNGVHYIEEVYSKFDHEEECINCDGTGYSGDFEVSWIDESNNDLNVYEYINY